MHCCTSSQHRFPFLPGTNAVVLRRVTTRTRVPVPPLGRTRMQRVWPLLQASVFVVTPRCQLHVLLVHDPSTIVRTQDDIEPARKRLRRSGSTPDCFRSGKWKNLDRQETVTFIIFIINRCCTTYVQCALSVCRSGARDVATL